MVKPVRVGFTTLLTGAIGAYVANEPAPILALLPTEADCRDYVSPDIEPIFAASPALRGALSADQEEGERNTLLSRRFPETPIFEDTSPVLRSYAQSNARARRVGRG